MDRQTSRQTARNTTSQKKLAVKGSSNNKHHDTQASTLHEFAQNGYLHNSTQPNLSRGTHTRWHTHTHKHLNTNSKIVNIHEEQLSLKTRTPNNRLRAGYALLASPPVASYTRPFSELCSVDFVSQRTTTNVPLLPALGECIDKWIVMFPSHFVKKSQKQGYQFHLP